MKKILYILAAAICLLTSCKKELKFPEKLYGDWYCHSTSLTSTDVHVYVTFDVETFVLYQKIGEGAYRIYNGTYTLTQGESGSCTLTGEYSDGTPWATEYVVVSSSNDVIVFTAGDVTEVYNRVKDGIPADVKNSASAVKSNGSAENSADGTDRLRFL